MIRLKCFIVMCIDLAPCIVSVLKFTQTPLLLDSDKPTYTTIPPLTLWQAYFIQSDSKFVKFDFTIPNSARLAIYGRRNFPPTIAQFDFYQVYDGSTIKEPESQTLRNRVSIQPLYLDI